MPHVAVLLCQYLTRVRSRESVHNGTVVREETKRFGMAAKLRFAKNAAVGGTDRCQRTVAKANEEPPGRRIVPDIVGVVAEAEPLGSDDSRPRRGTGHLRPGRWRPRRASRREQMQSPAVPETRAGSSRDGRSSDRALQPCFPSAATYRRRAPVSTARWSMRPSTPGRSIVPTRVRGVGPGAARNEMSVVIAAATIERMMSAFLIRWAIGARDLPRRTRRNRIRNLEFGIWNS
jgi:hypothetical protein